MPCTIVWERLWPHLGRLRNAWLYGSSPRGFVQGRSLSQLLTGTAYIDQENVEINCVTCCWEGGGASLGHTAGAKPGEVSCLPAFLPSSLVVLSTVLHLDLDGIFDPMHPSLPPEPMVVFAKEQPTRSEVQAMAGASATLSCEVAQAQTEVMWYKDGKKLSASSKVRVEARAAPGGWWCSRQGRWMLESTAVRPGARGFPSTWMSQVSYLVGMLN